MPAAPYRRQADRLTSYPSEPWDLHGHSVVGVWLLPRGQTPSPHSARTVPIVLFGRCLVAAAFFAYEEPSPLVYGEVMATVLVREGWRPRVSITQIWVDSPASRAGGRELWAIPKELADFEIEPVRRGAPRAIDTQHYAAHGICSADVAPARVLPFALPVGFRIAQDGAGRLVVSAVRGSARLGLVRAKWRFASDGPLAFLARRGPLLSLAARPFHVVFGQLR